MTGGELYPRRLWGLREMLEFKALPFYTATTAIRHLLATIDAQRLTSTQEEENGGVTVIPISDPVFLDRLNEQCQDLGAACCTLSARVTALAVGDLQRSLNEHDTFITFEGLAQSIKEIDATLKRELTLVTLLAMEPKEQALYQPTEPLLGSEFERKFPLALFDLDEAAKCLALSRPTAAAFHLMRLTELGLRATACLPAVLPSGGGGPQLGEVLKATKAAIDARNAAKSWTGNDRTFFESSYASLDAIRVAWRNPTMHIEIKYTLDEAEHIFGAAKGFMMKLASRCDENGDPKA